MWTRAELKQSAKDVLRNNYWMAFAVTLVYGILTGAASGLGSSVNSSSSTSLGSASGTSGLDSALVTTLVIMMLIAVAISVLISLGLSFFVFGPLNVGKNRYFMESRVEKSSFGQLFYGFKQNYMNNAVAMFLTNLYIGLWSLLLIVPGIIKSLQWSQVPYILAENPGMSGARARAISSQMTDGQKWEIFVLQLSFLGWELLGALLCGVGTLFVAPYQEATYAELYACLRDKALANGIATVQELPGITMQVR